MNTTELADLLRDVEASGISTPDALKGLKPEGSADDPDASASDEGQGGDPGASASDATPPGEGSPEDSDEALKGVDAVAVDADDLLDCVRDIVKAEIAKALAGVTETLKGLVGASTAQIGLARNALEIGLHNAETLKGLAPAVESLKSLATTPAVEPRRPGAAVSSRLPPPRDVPGAGGELTTAEVNKAINLKLINPVVGQQVLTAIQTSKPLPGDFDVAGLRERIAAAAAK